jgi:aryl-alcohol dehydrogenase-like predicted oxidoreductase
MEFVSLGASDIRISPVIMGTWQAGRDMWSGIEDADSTRALQAAVDEGITTFDTAEAYGKGHSERIVGIALKGIRDRVVIATKVFPNHFTYDQVLNACHSSLENLDTDYIDLYQLHWPSGSFGTKKVPIEDTMKAMNKLKDDGKIRSIGVSNFSAREIEEASVYARIDSLQPPYSLFWRQMEKKEMPYCIENNITVLAYSSMAQGILTGKFGSKPSFEKGDHRSKNRLFSPDHYERVIKALGLLKPIADRHGITLGQLALAWVISRKGVCAIAGARNEAQVRQNARAMTVSLTQDDLTQMDRAGRLVTDQLDDNPVLWEF